MAKDDNFLDTQKLLASGWSNAKLGYVAVVGDVTYSNATFDVAVASESVTYAIWSYSFRVGDQGATTYVAKNKWATFVPGTDENSKVYLGTVANMNDWSQNHLR